VTVLNGQTDREAPLGPAYSPIASVGATVPCPNPEPSCNGVALASSYRPSCALENSERGARVALDEWTVHSVGADSLTTVVQHGRIAWFDWNDEGLPSG
jgi:hypothetical protein